MDSKKKIIIFLVLIAILAGGFILVRSKQKALQEETTAYIHEHTPISVEDNQTKTRYELFTAKLEAKENPKLGTKVSGYIKKIYVQENQQVKKGEILVSIDASEYRESLLQLQYSAEATRINLNALEKTLVPQNLDMQQALKTFNANKKIFSVGGISQDQLSLSEIAYEQKQANYLATLEQIKAKELTLKSQEALWQSKKSLDQYYTITAPFDGIVENLYLSQGDLTQASKPILSLLSYKQKLTFKYANDSIKLGQDVFIENKKIGTVGVLYPSTQQYLKVAEIKLSKPIELPYNSLISIEVDVK